MAVEDKLLLYFPTTRYFFVQRSDGGEKLAQPGRSRPGTHDPRRQLRRHFRKRKGPLIERANLKVRRVFRIGNPFLSKETPLNRRELWFDPLAGR